MSQTRKLYKYYLSRIFKKNWLRIVIFTVLIGIVWWFVFPYVLLSVSKGQAKKNIMGSKEILGQRQVDSQISDIEEISFKDFSQYGFGDGEAWGYKLDLIRKINREELKKNIEKFQQEAEGGADEIKLEKLREKIMFNESFERSETRPIRLTLPYTSDNVFFFCQTEGYVSGKALWKTLNDISWWNLASFTILYWFIFAVLDDLFFSPRKDGEEAGVLILTPGVQRSDILWGKILAFLTFYSLANVLLFWLPFSIYYFWVGSNISLGLFSLLTLYTVVIGPILFFFLILAPYIFANSVSSILGFIASIILSFFGYAWVLGKFLLWKNSAWPYKVEQWFFDPLWFTVISLISGIFFLALYYWRYQEEDLG